MTGLTGPDDIHLASTVHRVFWSIVTVIALAAGVTFVVTLFTLDHKPSRIVATFVCLALAVASALTVRSDVVVSSHARVVTVRNPFRTVVVRFDAIADVSVKAIRRSGELTSSYSYQVRMTGHDGRVLKCRGLTGVGVSSYGSTSDRADRLRRLLTAS